MTLRLVWNYKLHRFVIKYREENPKLTSIPFYQSFSGTVICKPFFIYLFLFWGESFWIKFIISNEIQNHNFSIHVHAYKLEGKRVSMAKHSFWCLTTGFYYVLKSIWLFPSLRNDAFSNSASFKYYNFDPFRKRTYNKMVVRSRKRTLLWILLASIFIFTVVCLFTSRKIQNPLSTLNELVKPKVKEHLHFQDHGFHVQSLKANLKNFKPRRNIVIVSHVRSGSTITGDIFNHHPSVFYLHEPLQTVERISQRLKKTSNVNYGNLMADVLTNIFHCNFSKSVVEDIQSFYRESNHPRASHAIGSPPLCQYEMTDPRWDPKLCPPLKSESLGRVCRTHYEVNVAKILIPRIAEANISNILAACSPADVDCRIIFLIRDPRAVIPSARSVSLFGNDPPSDTGKTNLRRFAHGNCKQSEDNLEFVKNLPLFWQKRIMIQRYEDFAVDPLNGLSRLFEFAGLPVLESVKTWLQKRTHPRNDDDYKECTGNHPAFCTIDNSKEAVNRWRWKVAIGDIDIIEHYCKNVMELMGYRSIDQSYELMSNISIPLFRKGYEAKGWWIDG